MKIDFKLEKVNYEEKDILYRLLQYSLFEESISDLNEMNEQAVFEYKWFEKYFSDDDRIAYFIREERTNKLLGFVMINKYLQKFKTGHAIAEFMVIPKYRRKGIGKRAAVECFNKYKGNWEVKPSYGNKSAYTFWNNTINEYTNNKNRFEDGIFLFNNNMLKD